MSKEIDEKVLSMQFDNSKFENNVRTSLGTIEKLKQSLQFKDAGKGFDNLESAARKVNLNPLSNSVETVSLKISALQVAAVTAFANITNSAMKSAKSMVKAFTIDPVTTGFQEYETQLNAVQTILANTSHQGTTLYEVNDALDELNTYSDRTIYNFTEMTRNIGTFTAAGLDLKASTESIKGIANLAAMSGSTSQQASTAMYQLSQALAAGRVSLQDWNSVVNAGMGGKVFQDALVRTAAAMKGVSAEAFAAANGTDVFRESISNTGTGWLTTEVLSNTLRQFTGDLSEAELAAMGFTQEQIKSIQSMAVTANDAATKVKTFTMLMDTLKEAAQSGWAQTWELIFGDFEEAKAFWTDMSDTLGRALQEFSDARNELLGDALGKPASEWAELSARIEEAGISMEDFRAELIETAEAHDVHNLEEMKQSEESLIAMLENGEVSLNIITQTLNRMADADGILVDANGQVVSSMEDLQSVVTNVIRGDLGNGIERIEGLTDANYDAATVQNLVNTLWERNGHTWADCTLTAEELSQAIGEMSDAELESIGFTTEQVSAVRELADELANMDMDEWRASFRPTGRELFIDSIRNSLEALSIAFGAVRDAWNEVMPEFTSEDLYNIIEAIHSFTESMKMSEETADKVKRTFKGLFAILDVIGRVVGGVVKFAFKTLIGPLGLAGDGVLTMTSSVGDMIVAFRDWLVENDRLTRGIEFVGGIIVDCAEKVKEWIDAFLDLPLIQNGISNIKELFEDLKNVSLSDLVRTIEEDLSNFSLFEVGQNMIVGLKEGLEENDFSVLDFIFDLGRRLIEEIKEALDIHSPSREMKQVGEYAVEGLVEGIDEKANNSLWGKLEEIGENISEFFSNLEWDKIAALGISGVLLSIVGKLISVIESLAAPFKGVGDVLVGTGKVLEGAGSVLRKSAGKIKKILNAVACVIKSFSHYINAIAFKEAAQGLKDVAIAVAIMVAAVIALTFVDADKLWDAYAMVAALAAVLAVLAYAASKAGDSAFSLSKDGITISDTMGQLMKIAFAMIALAAVVKILGSMNPDQYAQGMWGLVALAGVMVAVIGAFELITKTDAGATIAAVSGVVIKIAAAMIVMAFAAKIVGGMDPGAFDQAVIFMFGFVGIIYAVQFISAQFGMINTAKFSQSILSITGAMILMAIAMKIVGGMDPEAFNQAVDMMALFGIFVGALMAAAWLMNPSDITALGTTMIALGGAMALMAIAMRIVGGMSPEAYDQGIGMIIMFGIFVGALMAVSHKMGPAEMANFGATMIALAGAMILMSIAMRIVGGMDPEALLKGLVAVGTLGLIVTLLMIAVGNLGSDAPKIILALLALSIAIGILAAITVIMGLIDETALDKGIAAVGKLALIAGLLAVVSGFGGKDCSKNILALAVAIAIIAAAAAGLSFIDTGSLWKAVGALSALMLVFGVVALMAGIMEESSFKSLIVMAAMLAIVAISLGSLSKIHPKKLETAAFALGGVMLALAVTMAIIANTMTYTTKTIVALGVMGVIIAILGTVLVKMAAMPWQNTIGAAVGLGIAMLAIAGAMTILSTTKGMNTGAIASLAIMIGAIYLLAMAIAIVAAIPWQNALGASVALGLIVVALAAALNMINVTGVAGAAALLVVSVALIAMAQAMIMLSGLSWEQVGIGLVTIASALVLLCAAGLVATYIAPGLIVLSVAILALSIGAMGLSVALMLAVIAFERLCSLDTSNLSANMTAMMAVFGVFIAFLIGMIPSLAVALGEGFIAILGVIAESGVVICETVTTIIVAILDAIIAVVPKICETFVAIVLAVIEAMRQTVPALIELLFYLLTTFLETLAIYSPQIVQAGYDILLSLLEGIANNIGGIVDAVGDIIIEFMNALGEKLPEINQAGIDMMINLINGLAQGIEDNADDVKAAIDNLCQAIFSAFCTFFGIQSPSTVFAEQGGYLIEGLINGIGDMIESVKEKVREVGGGIVSAIVEKYSGLREQGGALMTRLGDGISFKIAEIKSKAKQVIDGAKTAIEDKISEWVQAGKDLIDGLIEGALEMAEDLVEAVKGVVNDAIEAAKNLLGINSPSKVFMQFGRYVDEGFVIGMEQLSGAVSSASEGVGQSAIDGITSTLSNLDRAIDDNMNLDIQPAIRPVVDTSGLAAGNIQLETDFTAILDRPVVSMAQLMTDAQNQIHASNQEVVSAVTGLRDDLTTIFDNDGQEVALYVDSKKLATSLAKPMNRQLNILAQRGAY